MLWLVHRNRRNSGRVQILLSAALQNGWRILRASPEEQALLEAHGFGSGMIQLTMTITNGDLVGGRSGTA
jgi:hypothetical protein